MLRVLSTVLTLLFALGYSEEDGYAMIQFNCQTRQGSSTSNPSQMSSVSCEENETLVSCGISGWQQIGGTYIDPQFPNICNAITLSASYSVQAIANCCEFPPNSVNAIRTVTSVDTEDNGYQTVTVCPYGSTLTGCQVDYYSGGTPPGDYIRGSYPGLAQDINTRPLQIGISGGINTGNQCIVESRDNASTLRGGAQCIEFSPQYELQCVTTGEYATKDGFTGNCPTDYTLIACNTYTTTRTLDSWYLTTTGGCYVQQDDYDPQYANGICCQLRPTANS